ncbi:MAG: helix-turn-helix domain-containing protein [Candidatus Eremiobacteraeota bacterium]|nr:helix-turn-helix domain-containing protein [Candidatus Eremiobacteraeota bacterium]
MTSEQIVEFAERLARIAASGGGPAALAALLADTTRHGVLLEDAQWHRIAAAGEGLPPSARVAIERGETASSMKVVAGDAHLGWLSLFGNGAVGPDPGPDPQADLLLRLTAAAVAVELARHPASARGRRSAFWERLTGRGHHDAEAARDDAGASGIVLASAYLAIALEPHGDEAQRADELAQLRRIASDVFRAAGAEVGYLEGAANLLIFVPAAREVDASNARTAAGLLPKTVAKRNAGLRLSGGVGTVETPLGLHRSIDAAQAAAAIGRRILGAGRVVAYEDLGAYPLLYEGADVRRLQTFAHDALAPLRAYDEKHQTELERTLALYFEVGQNVKTAAARLNVHRHTVFYRLRQIGDICGRTLENPHDQLTLRLAVAVDALHSS